MSRMVVYFVGLLALCSCCVSAQAHIGSPNVFVEGNAGEYPVHIVIRPPRVVPGLAEISVRVAGEPVQRVTVLPVFWNAGRKGAPPPDAAKPVRGETNLFSAALWLMKGGAYSVEVQIEGAKGLGALVVPVDAIATNTRPMARSFRLLLAGLGGLLFLGGLKIASAMFGESRLEPGTIPTNKDKWRARAAVALTAIVLLGGAFGGKIWWDFEDAEYRNNSLYAALPVSSQVQIERGQPLLKVKVAIGERRGKWTPLIPDHGKIMHLFLVRDGEPGAFAHLHPVQRKEAEFEVPLPPLPTGPYHLYADVTHENGSSETLTDTVEIPPASLEMKRLWLGNSAEPVCSATVAQNLATNLFFPPDLDDSWQMDSANSSPVVRQTESRSPIGGDHRMLWENAGPLVANREASLRFKLITPDGQTARLESYMGMSGHAVVRRQDGTVFAHLHPMGTFSMAAQDFFLNGLSAKALKSNAQPALLAVMAQSPGPVFHSEHANEAGVAEAISFPYAFPEAGSYRIWIQMKSQGRILTGTFDALVAAER